MDFTPMEVLYSVSKVVLGLEIWRHENKKVMALYRGEGRTSGIDQAWTAGTPQAGIAGTGLAGTAGTPQAGIAGTPQAGTAGTPQAGTAGTGQAGTSGAGQWRPAHDRLAKPRTSWDFVHTNSGLQRILYQEPNDSTNTNNEKTNESTNTNNDDNVEIKTKTKRNVAKPCGLCLRSSVVAPKDDGASTSKQEPSETLGKDQPLLYGTIRRNGKRERSYEIESEERTAKVPKRHNEKIPIGTGQTLISKSAYENINWITHTLATRKLLMAVFPRSVLATHSLTGKASPAFQDKPAKQGLDPIRVADIVMTVTKKCNVPSNLVRNAITTKLADENKMMKQKAKKSPKPKRSPKPKASPKKSPKRSPKRSSKRSATQ